MPPRRPPRIPGFDYIGTHAYLVTTCTFARLPRFQDARIAKIAIEQLLRTAEECAFAVTAYCVMPDHVHLLVEGLSDDSDLRHFVKAFKPRAAFHVRELDVGPLWQEGYHDHVLRAEEVAARMVRYLLENPVRAGLVERPEDYAYSGSSVYELRDLLRGLY